MLCDLLKSAVMVVLLSFDVQGISLFLRWLIHTCGNVFTKSGQPKETATRCSFCRICFAETAPTVDVSVRISLPRPRFPDHPICCSARSTSQNKTKGEVLMQDPDIPSSRLNGVVANRNGSPPKTGFQLVH